MNRNWINWMLMLMVYHTEISSQLSHRTSLIRNPSWVKNASRPKKGSKAPKVWLEFRLKTKVFCPDGKKPPVEDKFFGGSKGSTIDILGSRGWSWDVLGQSRDCLESQAMTSLDP